MATGPTGAFGYIKSGKAVFDASSNLVAHSIRSNKINTANLLVDELDILHQQKISITGDLSVGNNATFFSNQNVNGATVDLDLSVGGAAVVLGDLQVDGPVSIDGAASVVNGNAVVGGLTYNNPATVSTLSIATDASAELVITKGLLRADDLTVHDLRLGPAVVLDNTHVGELLATTTGFNVDSSGNFNAKSLNILHNSLLSGLEDVKGSKSIMSDHNISQNMSVLQNKYIENHCYIEKQLIMDDASGNAIVLNGDTLRALLALL
jgi:hypothetical protein